MRQLDAELDAELSMRKGSHNGHPAVAAGGSGRAAVALEQNVAEVGVGVVVAGARRVSHPAAQPAEAAAVERARPGVGVPQVADT